MKLHYAEILADYNNDNPASGRVLRKLGFSEVGQSESFCMAQGKLVEVTDMRLAKGNWQKEIMS